MWYYLYPDLEKTHELPYFIQSIGLHELQPYIIKPDGHEYDQFFYNAKGSGNLVLNGKKYHLPTGCGFFIPAKLPHEYYPDGDIWDIRWMVPGGIGLAELYKLTGIKAGVYNLHNCNMLDIILNKMHDEICADSTYGSLYASTHVSEFITEFARQAGLLKSDNPPIIPENIYDLHMHNLSEYIETHYAGDIRMEDLCQIAHVSPQHICRIFRECTGMSSIEYIQKCRIEHAKELLISTTHSISCICRWCGFENENYFWKIFKKIEKTTPGEYRKKYQV